jgi:hypothetical protein
MLQRTTLRRSRCVSRFGGALFDHASRILVGAEPDKLGMPESASLGPFQEFDLSDGFRL